MQTIPSNILDKLNQSMQTIGNNAQPRMEVIAQKASRYISQGNFLSPKTVRTGNALKGLDICIRREDPNQEPSEIVMVYIENGVAKVATLPYVSKLDENFTYKYTVGPADEVACDFDGSWYKISNRSNIYFDTAIRWTLVTSGDPYISIIKNGKLTIQQGQAASFSLVDTDVVKCSILRGWKSVGNDINDQGFICAYIKTDGKVYYRNYCIQSDGSYTWELERVVSEFTPPIENLGLFRSFDYRMGFIAEKSGNMLLLMTNRSWAEMAIDPENISVGIKDFTIKLQSIKYHDSILEENISVGIKDFTIGFGMVINPVVTRIYNVLPDVTHLILKFSHKLTENLSGRQAAFTVKDASNVTYTVSATSAGSDQSELILTLNNFNGAKNPLSVTYSKSIGQLSSRNGTVDFFVEDFTMSGTVDIDPPKGFVDENIKLTLINYILNLTKINYSSRDFSENIKVGISNISITVTKVGNNPL